MATLNSDEPVQAREVRRVRTGRAASTTQAVCARDVLVVIPTYNEASNIQRIVRAVLAACRRVEVLIVDDHSPDGTGHLTEQLAATEPRVHVLHRRGPRGLGAAYMAGFRWALRRKAYQCIVQMDADFSHDPATIPKLLDSAERYDLVIGSRYCGGGRTAGWPWRRRWLSFAANLYARTLLSSGIRDLTSGFRCWRREVLQGIDFARLRSNGYEFQVEMGHLAELAGARIREVPITFRERSDGTSKMSVGIARRAAWQTARLASDRVLGVQHPGLLPKPGSRVTGNGEDDTRTSTAVLPRNVLVMCLGGIGDTVLSFAMLRQLRQRLPHSRLTALAMWPQSAELLEDLGIFDEIRQHNFQEDRPWRSFKKLIELHFERFDLSILAYPANRWEFNLAAWLVHAGRRVGHKYEVGDDVKLDFLLTDRVRQTARTHNVDENLKLLSGIPNSARLMKSQSGGPAHVNTGSLTDDGHTPLELSRAPISSIRVPRNELPPPGEIDIRLGPLAREYHDYAGQLLAEIPGPYLGIHAGSSTAKNLVAKRWPAEHFAELCRSAQRELGLTPLLFGAGEEMLLNNYIAGQCATLAGPIARVVTTPSICHTTAVMQRCSAFVSNDSSLAHIASALDVPTVMIVGPTDPAEVGPYGSQGIVAAAGLSCSPCYRPCRESLRCSRRDAYDCLHRITPQAVLRCVQQMVLAGADRDGASVAEKRVCSTASAALPTDLTRAETNGRYEVSTVARQRYTEAGWSKTWNEATPRLGHETLIVPKDAGLGK